MTRMAATRDGYGQALLDLASNEKVVVLEADLGKSTKSLHFRKAYPERTFSFGIGEQNMMLGAAGLASSGYHLHLPSLLKEDLNRFVMELPDQTYQFIYVEAMEEYILELTVHLLSL